MDRQVNDRGADGGEDRSLLGRAGDALDAVLPGGADEDVSTVDRLQVDPADTTEPDTSLSGERDFGPGRDARRGPEDR